jgi:hypothetical protein
MRAAAGSAEDRELLDSEFVRDGLDIGDDIGDLPEFQSIGVPIAGPIEGDQPHAEPVQDHRTGEGGNSTAGCPVHHENRVAGWASRQLNCRVAAVRQAHLERHRRPSPLAAVRMTLSIAKKFMERSQLAPIAVDKTVMPFARFG